MSRFKFRAFFNGSMYHDSEINVFELRGDDVVIEQWTGLQDKNGVDIYESDVVEWKDNILVVSWSSDDGGWVALDDRPAGGMATQAYMLNFEVTGNIHEGTK